MDMIIGIVVGAAFSKFWLAAWNYIVPAVKTWLTPTKKSE